jgi:alkaline phosphatase D
MPIREPDKGVSLAEACHRSFQVGDLATIVMLETRLTARSKQLTYDADLPVVDGKPDVAAFMRRFHDPARRMMSPAQEAWLGDQLEASVKAGQAWQVIGSGVVMGRLKVPNPKEDFTPDELAQLGEPARKRLVRMQPVAELGLPYGLDMWDGYPIDRERVYAQIRRAKARPIVVSGDSHAFWANELADDKGRRVACEFGGTAITSTGADDALKPLKVGPAFVKRSPEVKFCDQGAKGFVLLTLSRKEAKAELMAVSTITSTTFTTRALKTFRVTPEGTGVSGLQEV